MAKDSIHFHCIYLINTIFRQLCMFSGYVNKYCYIINRRESVVAIKYVKCILCFLCRVLKESQGLLGNRVCLAHM